MAELPPDPDRLRFILAYLEERIAENSTVGVYLRLQRDAVREALARAEEHPPTGPGPRTRRPQAPPALPVARGARETTGFAVERQRRAVGPEPARIHIGDCTTGGPKHPIGAQEARAALVDPMVEACPFCRPDAALGVDLG